MRQVAREQGHEVVVRGNCKHRKHNCSESDDGTRLDSADKVYHEWSKYEDDEEVVQIDLEENEGQQFCSPAACYSQLHFARRPNK